jgi:hypothetical protein
MKGLAEMLTGFAILAGMLFGLFVIVVAPFEMWKKAEAETWPARKGVITTSHAAHQQGGAGGRAYWKAEICGTYKDKAFCILPDHRLSQPVLFSAIHHKAVFSVSFLIL